MMRAGIDRRKARGFTLIELLVVIAIIGILAAVAVGNYQRSIRKAQEAALMHNLYTMRQAIYHYFYDKGKYPYDLQALVEERYLEKMPVDPVTRSTDTWITEQAELTDQDISTEPGIANVRSGAEGYALDGTAYQDL